MTVRVRYAPSPTGHLHIGGVRTALFNFLFARHHGGEFILRSEDTDLDRNVPGAEEEILRGFQWLGFAWDEGPDIGGPYAPYRCTERLDIYTTYLQKLLETGQVYPCFCTQEELESERASAHAAGRMPHYNGKCRHMTPEERENKWKLGIVPNYRFAVPSEVILEFNDLVRGKVSFQSADMGDFVIVKSNGIPTYNFQVVIDDALMQISHVIRGEEHLSNTPRQILLFRALGFSEPVFAHLPQVLDVTRKKLSKRDPNVMPVHVYREKGYLPESLMNFLVLLGWSPAGEEEILSLEQMIRQFDLDRVNKSGAVFDVDKLAWMANQYFKVKPIAEVVALIMPLLKRKGWSIPEGASEDWLFQVVALYQEKMSYAEEFLELAKVFFDTDVQYEPEAIEVLKDPVSSDVIASYLNLISVDEEWTAEASRLRFKQIQQQLGVKGRALFMPIRAALTGTIHGPDLQKTIACLPKLWVMERLNLALQRLL